jgi:hypothetical protein
VRKLSALRYLVLGLILALMSANFDVSAAPEGFGPEMRGECGDDTCDEGEDAESCPQDCRLFIVGYCGDGTCDEGEESTCPDDCGMYCVEMACAEGEFFDWELCRCQFAGDTCLPQSCAPEETFDTNLCQCVGFTNCGDDNCDANCPQDCVSQTPLTYCGDGTCDEDENYNICAQDCPSSAPAQVCGDGTCDENSENYQSCPTDCGKGIGGELLGPLFQPSDDTCEGQWARSQRGKGGNMPLCQSPALLITLGCLIDLAHKQKKI